MESGGLLVLSLEWAAAFFHPRPHVARDSFAAAFLTAAPYAAFHKRLSRRKAGAGSRTPKCARQFWNAARAMGEPSLDYVEVYGPVRGMIFRAVNRLNHQTIRARFQVI